MMSIVDDKNLGFALGASEYLTKPIERDQLIKVLRRHSRPPTNGRPLVLVVEDDARTRGVLRRTMEREGWEVAEAEHGRLALDRVRERMPDLVLLDLMMPEMNGFEFLGALREWEAGRSAVPVVVITAKELTADDRKRLNGGVERVVAKGGHGLDGLAATIRQHVLRREGAH